MTICKKRLAPLLLALLLAVGLIAGAAPVTAGAIQEHVVEFLDVIGPMATADMQQNGILASLTIAQAILESDYGRSLLAGKQPFRDQGLQLVGRDGLLHAE